MLISVPIARRDPTLPILNVAWRNTPSPPPLEPYLYNALAGSLAKARYHLRDRCCPFGLPLPYGSSTPRISIHSTTLRDPSA